MQRRTLFVAATLAVGAWVGSMLYAPSPVHADGPSTDAPHITVESSIIKTDSYTVQSGDYLQEIAESHNINWPSIYELNSSIDNPDLIYPDQQLDIPEEDVPLTRSLPQTTLTVPQDYAPAPVEVAQTSTTSKSKEQKVSPTPTQQTTLSLPSGGSYGVPGLAAVLHSPYVYGGNTPAGFDCSGLTRYLAAQRGISLPRTVSAQYYATRHISLADAQAGDLIFFNMGHVGMYLGGGKVVHATNPKQGIVIDSLQTAIQYNGFMGVGALGH